MSEPTTSTPVRKRSRSTARSPRAASRLLSLSPDSPRIKTEEESAAEPPASPTTTTTTTTAEAGDAPEDQAESTTAFRKFLTPAQAAMWTALISLLAIPIVFVLDESFIVAGPLGIALIGVVVLVIVFVIAEKFLFFRLPTHARDPYISWFVLFAFTSIVDLVLAAEIDFKLGVFEWYLDNGERYLQGPFGASINWWDASAHWLLYIIMVYGLCHKNPAPFRPIFLYWVGSIVNSLFVLVPGAVVGSSSHNLTYSTLLNIPYIFIPLIFAKKAFSLRRSGFSPYARGRYFNILFDLFFVAFFVFAMIVYVLRFAVAMDSKWDISISWRQNFDPILADPSNFFKVQGLVNFFYFLPLSAAFIFAIFVGGHFPVLRDLVFIFAGASAQSQFVQLRCGGHWETHSDFRADNHPGFWIANIVLFLVPHLFAFQLWKNTSFHGIFSAKK